jgi:2-oxo-4-hydroxy-4-carboxy--5-ureidoimidazoline (OHCU) decarboxylase
MVAFMSQPTEKPVHVMPSATPTEAELAAWADLPHDEQTRRYQESFRHPDCNTFTTDTSDDILAAARRRIASRPSN